MDNDGGDNYDDDSGGSGGDGDEYTEGDHDGSPVSNEHFACATSTSHVCHSKA